MTTPEIIFTIFSLMLLAVAGCYCFSQEIRADQVHWCRCSQCGAHFNQFGDRIELPPLDSDVTGICESCMNGLTKDGYVKRD